MTLQRIEFAESYFQRDSIRPPLREARQLTLLLVLALALAGCGGDDPETGGGVGGGSTAIVDTRLRRPPEARPYVEINVRTRSSLETFVVRLTFIGTGQSVLGRRTVEVPARRWVPINVPRAVRKVEAIVVPP